MLEVRVIGQRELDRKVVALNAEAKRFQRRISSATRAAVDRVYRPALISALPEFVPDRYAGVLGADLKTSTSVRFAGAHPGVGVAVTAPTGGPQGRDISALEYRGVLSHPLFGDKRHWYRQSVVRGFASKPAKASRPAIVAEIDKELAELKKRLEAA